MRRFLVVLPLSLALLAACSGGGGDGGSTTFIDLWPLTVDEAATEYGVTTLTATLRSDGGISITGAGLVGADDATFSMSVGGGITVQPDVAISISSGGINSRMSIDTLSYRGTGGTLTFSAYEPLVDGRVTGSFDIDFVTTEITVSGVAALQGDFDLTVTAPTPTPTPTPSS